MTIRFLDPPLHEFLPTKEEDIDALAKDLGMTVEASSAMSSTACMSSTR